MIEFTASLFEPKWMIQKKKHRLTFNLNEGNENLIATAGVWAFKKQLLRITAKGNKGLDITIVALCEKYKFEFDHSLSIIFDCFEADGIVEDVAKSCLRGEILEVTVEETEKPNGMAARSVRQSTWETN